jgi:DNA-binding MurR/RpiR family transcriptional regulator
VTRKRHHSSGLGTDSFLNRIQTVQPRLPPVQRRILDAFLSRPHEAVFFNTTAIARELRVSEASVVRLCHTLGFEGFREFQTAFRHYASEPHSRASRVRLMARRRGSLTQLVDDVMNNDINNLQATHRSIDHGLILKVAETLWRARTVHIVGMRSAHSLAVFLHFGLRLLGRSSRLLTPGIGDLPEQLVQVDRRDVAVGISFERYAKVSIDLFAACVARGATGIGITDKPTSPLAQHAELVLMCETRYLTFIDSYVAPFSLANAILTVLAVQRRRSATRSLARIEKAWQQMDTYS